MERRPEAARCTLRLRSLPARAQSPDGPAGPGLREPRGRPLSRLLSCAASGPSPSRSAETMLPQFGAQTYDQHMEMW